MNTGWTGGPFGEGSRMPIKATRALLRAALAGELDAVHYRTDGVFGFEVPGRFPASTRSSSILGPPGATRAYDAKARELAELFRDNFSQFDADDNIVAGGPRI